MGYGNWGEMEGALRFYWIEEQDAPFFPSHSQTQNTY